MSSVNPSNQPELNQTQVNYPGNAAAHQRDTKGLQQNDPSKEVVSPLDRHTSNADASIVSNSDSPNSAHTSSIPDAQAEVGLRELEKDLMASFEQLASANPEYMGTTSALSIQTAQYYIKRVERLIRADKAAAMAEAYKMGLMTGAMPKSIGEPIAEDYLSRLQPPTAGEGESV